MKTVYYTAEKEKVLRDVLRELFSSRLIKKLKTQGSVTLEGEPVKADRKLQKGDKVVFTFPEERNDHLPLDMDITPVYEDEDYLVVDKGRGVTCMPTGKASVFNGLKALYPNENFHVITRLDKDTVGLVLLAKSSLSASKMKEVTLEKRYLALVEGEISAPCSVNEPISRAGDIKRVVSSLGKPAITNVTPLSFDGAHTLVECSPLTGRTHQIRVHLAHIGHSIVGDTLYGNGQGEYNSGQQLLCKRLSFLQPFTKKQIDVQSKREL